MIFTSRILFLFFRVTTPSNTQTLTSPGRLGGPIERLLVELALSVLIMLAHFAADSPRSLPPAISTKASGVLAAAYTAATLVSVSFLLVIICNLFDLKKKRLREPIRMKYPVICNYSRFLFISIVEMK